MNSGEKGNGLFRPRVRRRAIDGQLRLMGDFALPENQRLLVWMQQAYASDERVARIHQFYETFDARGEMTQRRMVEIRFALIEHDEFLARARGRTGSLRVVWPLRQSAVRC